MSDAKGNTDTSFKLSTEFVQIDSLRCSTKNRYPIKENRIFTDEGNAVGEK